jgi:hypothetical protein
LTAAYWMNQAGVAVHDIAVALHNVYQDSAQTVNNVFNDIGVVVQGGVNTIESWF